MTFAELAKKRDEILAIAKRHGAHNLRVFGSVANDAGGDQSDIDFLVEFDPDRSLLDQVRLIHDLEELLGRDVDVAEPTGLHRMIRNEILQQARTL
ncbi:MAG: nucleotidyltransferase family protein [Phycisphaeraceae bacterium]